MQRLQQRTFRQQRDDIKRNVVSAALLGRIQGKVIAGPGSCVAKRHALEGVEAWARFRGLKPTATVLRRYAPRIALERIRTVEKLSYLSTLFGTQRILRPRLRSIIIHSSSADSDGFPEEVVFGVRAVD